ncbi:hypothetical protein MY10362_009541 [Beauveria mimosiformis]
MGGCLDILNLLGDHVNNKKLLYNICLVSRHFNYVFSKRLWRRLEFDDLNKHCFTDDERRGIILQSKLTAYQDSHLQHLQINRPISTWRLFEELGTMRSLEDLWLEAYSYSKIKSHASVTPEEADDLQFVLSNLAAACRRLHYVKIGKLAWRIHPKVRHTKQQVCTFEEIDAWEAAAEGPAAFLGPNPFDRDVFHKDWW